MDKHTRGPWTLEIVSTVVGTCHKIGPFPSNGVHSVTHACVYADNVRLGDYGNSKTGDELRANSELMRASPELLEMVREYRSLVHSDYSPAHQDRLDRIDDAIERATGVRP